MPTSSSFSQSGSDPASYSVTEVLNLIRLAIADRLPRIAIHGEVSGLTKARSGHCYFALKDPASDRGNQIQCVMWRSSVVRLGFELAEGVSVVAVGEPTVYEVSGRLQLVLSQMTPLGDGLLQERFRKLKASLEKEGLFAKERKKKLPLVPKGIGIVTSKSGAAIHDLLVRLADRMPHIPVFLVDARVQGEGSVEEIVKGIKILDGFEKVDLIVVTRGGGSLQDLWSFNEEGVVRAVYNAQKPIVSAIGHEVDITLCDLAADLRAPTPTAAAELIVPDRTEILNSLVQLEARLQIVPRLIKQLEQRVDDLDGALLNRIQSALHKSSLRLKAAEAQLATVHPQRIISTMRERLIGLLKDLRLGLIHSVTNQRESLGFFGRALSAERLRAYLVPRYGRIEDHEERLKQANTVLLREKSQSLDRLERELILASPHKVLERGFCLIQQDGKVKSRVADIAVSSSIEVVFSDGMAEADVTSIKPSEAGARDQSGIKT